MMIGTKLGAFEILGLLGEGGMGQVYRARDSRLHRDVALKLLPTAFASDHDRLLDSSVKRSFSRSSIIRT
jgi:serine/threonine protein kinase